MTEYEYWRSYVFSLLCSLFDEVFEKQFRGWIGGRMLD
jgi:hypothetical protein